MIVASSTLRVVSFSTCTILCQPVVVIPAPVTVGDFWFSRSWLSWGSIGLLTSCCGIVLLCAFAPTAFTALWLSQTRGCGNSFGLVGVTRTVAVGVTASSVGGISGCEATEFSFRNCVVCSQILDSVYRSFKYAWLASVCSDKCASSRILKLKKFWPTVSFCCLKQ